MELNVPLPDFLTRRDDGEIVVTGTRVTLYLFLFDFNAEETPELLSERYPHIPMATIRDLIYFYREHQSEVDAFLKSYGDKLARTRAANEGVKKPWEERLLPAVN